MYIRSRQSPLAPGSRATVVPQSDPETTGNSRYQPKVIWLSHAVFRIPKRSGRLLSYLNHKVVAHDGASACAVSASCVSPVLATTVLSAMVVSLVAVRRVARG
jgi:hypothetical protein